MKYLLCNAIPTIILLLLCIHQSCTNQSIAGSETTNGLTVSISSGTVTGITIPNNQILCFSIDYNPDSCTGISDTVNSDSKGIFNYGFLDNSDYNFFTYSTNGDSVAIVQDFKVNASISASSSVPFDKTMGIAGVVTKGGEAVSNAKVFLNGSPFITRSNADGSFSLDHIPNGSFTIRAIYAERNWDKGMLNASKNVIIDSDTVPFVNLELK